MFLRGMHQLFQLFATSFPGPGRICFCWVGSKLYTEIRPQEPLQSGVNRHSGNMPFGPQQCRVNARRGSTYLLSGARTVPRPQKHEGKGGSSFPGHRSLSHALRSGTERAPDRSDAALNTYGRTALRTEGRYVMIARGAAFRPLEATFIREAPKFSPE